MPSSVPKKCHEVIKSLLPFWRTRPDFGSHLMSQFLDDVGGYVEVSLFVPVASLVDGKAFREKFISGI